MAPLRIQELLRLNAFPHEVAQLQLRETHIWWVLLTGPFAYKIKKLDFIDASTLELRRHYCNEELRLNRRLAPDVLHGHMSARPGACDYAKSGNSRSSVALRCDRAKAWCRSL